jgi:PAS domain S-box-containing protein
MQRAMNLLQSEQQRFRNVLDQLPAYLILLSPDHRVAFANRFFEERFGKSEGRRCYEYLFQRTEPCEKCDTYEVLKTGVPHRWEWTGPDGHNYDIHDFPFTDVDGSPLIMEVGLDITERKRAEGELAGYREHLEELVRERTQQVEAANAQLQAQIAERGRAEENLRRLNRALRARSHSDQAMMRAQEESAYLNEVCQIVVRDCDHAMVWIGYAEDDEGKCVRPVANAGFEKGYLETLKITWADTERGRGPTGTAIRTGQPCLCRNMPTDPAFSPWRAEALKRGDASSMALPLRTDGRTLGAITIYAREPDSFTDDEVALLGNLADDTAYGIAALRLRRALRESEEQFHTMANAMPQLAWMARADGYITWYNQRWYDYTGTTPEQMAGWGWQCVHDAEALPKVMERWKTCLATGQPFEMEFPLRGADGCFRQFLTRGFPVKNSDGRVVQWFGTNTDITERKQAEETLRRSNARLDLLAETASDLLRSDAPQQIVNSLCQKVLAFLDCQVFFNYLVDEKEGGLHLNSSAGIPEEEARRIEKLDYGTAVCGCVARDGCRIVAEDIQTGSDPRTNLVKAYGIQAYACHPLLMQGRVIGTLSFGTRTRTRFTHSELSLMKAITDQVAIAMERQRSQEALRHVNEELEQRVAERTAELRATSLYARSLIEASLDPLVTISPDGKVTDVNEATEHATGVTRDRLVGSDFSSYFTEPDKANAGYQKVLNEGLVRDYPLTIRHASGRTTDVLYNATMYRNEAGAVEGVFAAARDVTERKRVEGELAKHREHLEEIVQERTSQLEATNARLHESEQRVRRKLESVLSPEGDLGALDLGDFIDVPALQKLMDDFYAVAHIPMALIDVKGRVLVGVGWQDICTRFHRTNPETGRFCLESDTQLTSDLAQGESRLYKCKNNLWDMATPIFVSGQRLGNVFTGQFFFEDETVDREFFLGQARKYGFDEQGYLAALDGVPRLSRATVSRGIAFLRGLADTLSQLGHSNIKLARLLAERDRLTHSLRELNATLESKVAERTAELQQRAQQLEEAWAKVRSESEARIAALEQLRHEDRLKTVGKLASGIAHELGTPLNVISGYAGMIAGGSLSPQDVTESARTIKSQSERIANSVRQILDFARRRPSQRSAVNLPQLVRQTLDLLGPIAQKQNVRLVPAAVDETAAVRADVEQLRQVLLNLITNGVQAMPRGGKLEVTIGPVRGRLPADKADAGKYVCISVLDEGEGISEDNLRRLFEPFFTTKGPGKGTGLGLAIADGIIREHGGWITVESALGQGSRFCVHLPKEEETCRLES